MLAGRESTNSLKCWDKKRLSNVSGLTKGLMSPQDGCVLLPLRHLVRTLLKFYF